MLRCSNDAAPVTSNVYLRHRDSIDVIFSDASFPQYNNGVGERENDVAIVVGTGHALSLRQYTNTICDTKIYTTDCVDPLSTTIETIPFAPAKFVPVNSRVGELLARGITTLRSFRAGTQPLYWYTL